MNWIKKDNLEWAGGEIIKASIGDYGHMIQVFIYPFSDMKRFSEGEIEAAKEWAETRMNEFKKEFILSLIIKEGEDIYGFGGPLNINIIGGYDGEDEWTVYGTRFKELHKGTLEECKNFIAECF